MSEGPRERGGPVELILDELFRGRARELFRHVQVQRVRHDDVRPTSAVDPMKTDRAEPFILRFALWCVRDILAYFFDDPVHKNVGGCVCHVLRSR